MKNFLLFFAIFLLGCSPGNQTSSDMNFDKRPPFKKIMALHPDSADKQLPGNWEELNQIYFQENPKLPDEIKSAISNHEIGNGMSCQEVILAIGEPSSKTNKNNTEFQYDLEGWRLVFNKNDFLIEVYEI